MEEEYLLSKSLLFANLQSSNIHKLAGAVIQKAISNFIRMGVEPYKADFVYYFKKLLLTFDEVSNPAQGRFLQCCKAYAPTPL
jgi:hypothetical protein